jgi:formate hydrogenlyase subunit 6/NADH:ubiquinone oxidoreductase subunit I
MPLDLARRLLSPLREPVVSSRYPAVPPLLAPAVRGLPAVDPAACTRDGACVTACPTAAIRLTDEGWSLDAGRCVFCAACALACPNMAIRLGDRVELAGRDRAGLISVTPLEKRR